MLIASVIVLIVAVALFVIGVCLWPSRHDMLSGFLIFVGFITALFIVPWMVNVEEVAGRADWIQWYGKVLHFLDTWNWLISLIVALLLFVDAGAALSKKWEVNAALIPHRLAAPAGPPAPGAAAPAPAGTMQWQQAFILIALGLVALILGIFGANDAYADYQRPKVNEEFIAFQEKTKDVEGISTELVSRKSSVTIVFQGDALTATAAADWKNIAEEEYYLKEGSMNGDKLVIDTVHSIIARSYDGKTISEILVEFTGKIDKTDTEEERALAHMAYPVPSNLSEQGTKDWLQQWVNSTVQVTVPSTGGGVPTAARTGTGRVLQPPTPSSLIRVIRK